MPLFQGFLRYTSYPVPVIQIEWQRRKLSRQRFSIFKLKICIINTAQQRLLQYRMKLMSSSHVSLSVFILSNDIAQYSTDWHWCTKDYSTPRTCDYCDGLYNKHLRQGNPRENQRREPITSKISYNLLYYLWSSQRMPYNWISKKKSNYIFFILWTCWKYRIPQYNIM